MSKLGMYYRQHSADDVHIASLPPRIPQRRQRFFSLTENNSSQAVDVKIAAATMTDITVIHAGDAIHWVDYLERNLKESKLEVAFLDLDNLLTDLNDSYITCTASKALVCIMTPEMSDAMVDDYAKYYPLNGVFSRVTNGAFVFCGLEESEAMVQTTQTIFPKYKRWAKFSLLGDADSAHELICFMINIMDRDKPDRLSSRILRKETIKDHKETVIITPTDFIHEVTEEIFILFARRPESKAVDYKVEVRHGSKIVPAQKINSLIYKFIPPGEWLGDIAVNIVVIAERETVVSTLTIACLTKQQHVQELLEESITPMTLLCEALSVPNNDAEALDRIFTDMFKRNKPNLMADCLRMLADCTGPSNETSKKDLPTLLHFAARYNLKDFAATLLESPGARLAYGIENFEGHMPGQIAHKYGHNDLEEYLRTFMEFEDAAEMYTSMKALDGQVSTPDQLDSDNYTDMSAIKASYNLIIYEDGDETKSIFLPAAIDTYSGVKLENMCPPPPQWQQQLMQQHMQQDMQQPLQQQPQQQGGSLGGPGYMTMKKISDMLPALQPCQEDPVSENEDEEEDNPMYDYTRPETWLTPSKPGVRTDPVAAKPTLAETSSAPPKKESPAQEKTKAKTLPTEKISLFDDADSGNNHAHIPGLSDRQKQLVDYQLQVKEGEISIGEAEHLLQDWLLRGRMRSDNSFKEKKKQLHVLREQHKKALKVDSRKRKKSLLGKLFSREPDPVRSPSTKFFTKVTSPEEEVEKCEEQKPEGEPGADLRPVSTASSSSSESRHSASSRDSGSHSADDFSDCRRDTVKRREGTLFLQEVKEREGTPPALPPRRECELDRGKSSKGQIKRELKKSIPSCAAMRPPARLPPRESGDKLTLPTTPEGYLTMDGATAAPPRPPKSPKSKQSFHTADSGGGTPPPRRPPKPAKVKAQQRVVRRNNVGSYQNIGVMESELFKAQQLKLQQTGEGNAVRGESVHYLDIIEDVEHEKDDNRLSSVPSYEAPLPPGFKAQNVEGDDDDDDDELSCPSVPLDHIPPIPMMATVSHKPVAPPTGKIPPPLFPKPKY